MRNPNIAAVLRAIHADPSKGWTLTALAIEGAMSRSSLVSRFRELVGVSVRGHITQLRMAKAAAMLEDGDLSNAEIASRVGYESEAAFSRAFSREMGIPPGEFRKNIKQA